jgi:hypothetical protein
MEQLQYKCPKCGHDECETDSIRVTGSFISKIFDIQSRKFATVTCKQCKYTEIYKADVSTLGNIFDLFTN